VNFTREIDQPLHGAILRFHPAGVNAWA
jgi:hypothetical protein